ncbi:hypothetical protein OH686_04265 [Pseudomonas sp. SO81]|nr:hypothetical protein OH686_04265 [Pseudomonas sp. SO81]
MSDSPGAPGSRPTRDYSRSIPRDRFYQGFFDARHASPNLADVAYGCLNLSPDWRYLTL